MARFFADGNASPLDLIKAIEKAVSEKKEIAVSEVAKDGSLPKIVTFPYSRHSSYKELCDLVRIFKPKDVYQCTIDEETWGEGKSRKDKRRPNSRTNRCPQK